MAVHSGIMGRRRQTNLHLPPRLRLKHGAYYYTPRIDGKQKWIRLSDNYGEALAKWAEYEGREGANTGLIGGMIDRFMLTELPKYSDKTQDDYRRWCGDLRRVFGDTGLEDVKPHHLTAYLRRATHKVQANRQISLLSRMFSVAINEWGWLETNPCREVHRNREEHRARYITDAELAQLRKHASEQMRAVLELAYLTAARKGDLLKLMVNDDHQDGLHVRQQKTGKYQIFTWTPALRAAFDTAKRARPCQSSLYLFCTKRGAPHSVSGFNSMWRRLKTRAGLPDLHFHDLRAKSVTDAKNRYGRDFAQALAGHASGEMTERYVRENPNTMPLR